MRVSLFLFPISGEGSVEMCCSITMSLLQTEVAEDPEKISTVHLHLGLPLVFILSQKETYEADRRTAEFVAWQLLGKAGVALLSRYFFLDVLEFSLPFVVFLSSVTPPPG